MSSSDLFRALRSVAARLPARGSIQLGGLLVGLALLCAGALPAIAAAQTGGAPPVAVNDPPGGGTYPVAGGVTFDSALLATPYSVFDNDTLNGASSVTYGPSGPLASTPVDGSTTVSSFMGGTVLMRVNGTFVYTPPAGFVGTDRFFYKLQNASGIAQAQAIFTVSAAVTAGAPPVAVADGGAPIYVTGVNRPFGRSSTGGVLANDTPNGATITSYGASTGNEQTAIGAATPTAQGGSVTLNSDGSFSFTPKANFSGNDTFKYTLTNAAGSSTATATIFVDVLPAVTGTAPANGSTGVSIGTSIMINFNKAIDTTNAFTVTDTTSSTSVSFTQAPADGNATSTFTLTPSAALVGGHVFTVTVVANQTADPDAGQSMAANYVFSFTTLPPPAPVNDPPGGGTYPVAEGVTFDSALLATPYSVFDNDTLNGASSVTYGPSGPLASTPVDGSTTVSSFMGGTVLMRVNGTFVYTPPAGFVGTDRFFYKLQNASGIAQAQAIFTVSAAVPTVTGISPTSGPTAGGTSVTITGTNFTGATAVTIGSNAATFTVNGPTQITATTPAGTAGTASVVVTNSSGSNAANTLYTYAAPPTVAGISPTSGSTSGGTSVTITGANFTGATAVTLGGAAATTFTVNGPTQITATAPAGTAGTASVVVTTPGGSNAANTLYTYVAPPTVTGISPTSGPTAGGTSVTINGSDFTGATAVTIGGNAATFTVNGPTQITATTPAGTAGTASVVVTTPSGANSANSLYTYVTPAPTVTAISPTSGSTLGGTPVTIVGTGFTGATAVNIGGAAANAVTVVNSTTLTATTPAGSAGTASVVVTTPAGSNSANTLYTYTAAPTVSTNPVSQSISAGSNVTFTAAATGNPTPTVQWQQSTDSGASFTNVSGATSTTLSFTTTSGQNGNQYRAVFTNTPGSATTAAATLTVTAGPVVTTNPTDTTVNAGGSASFTAAASGTPTPTVQWQKSTDGGATYNNISGATSTTLSFTAASGDNGSKYRAVFTNASGSATTTAAALTVNFAPTVSTNPVSQSISAGSNVTFTAAATGNPTPTVQWQQSTDGGASFTNISGATSTTLSFTTASGDNGSKYRAVFTNASGSGTTTAAALTVNFAPTVSTNPVSQSISAGSNVTFTAAATGNPTPTVQWQQSTDGGASFTNVSGATSTTLSFTSTSGQNGNQYRAVFTNTPGSATTAAATLTVNFAPTVGTNPVSQSISAGSNVTFTAAATGNPTPTVQWQQSTDGGASFTNVSGATSNTLSFTTTSGQSGNQYRAVFTNTPGTATTTAATLTVTAGPVVTTNPTGQTANIGQTATFTAAASGTPTPTIQWQKSTDSGASFSNILGATSNTLSFTAAFADNNSQYRAVFTNASGSATTSSATLTVNGAANTITFAQPADTAFSSTPPTLSASASSGVAPSFSSNSTGVCTVTSGGTLTFVSTGPCSITASQGATGSFAAATPVTRTFNVTPAVTPPVAGATSTTVAANSINNPVPLNLSGGAATSVAIDTPPSHGTASVSGLTITYTPTAGYSGPDSFTYIAGNGAGSSAPATATITVDPALTPAIVPTLSQLALGLFITLLGGMGLIGARRQRSVKL